MSGRNPGLASSSGYQIRTKGHISDHWSDWFEGMTLVHDTDGTTVICCPSIDQAALHGLLTKVRDLGLQLISVTPMGAFCAALLEERTNANPTT
ncbi:MAG TPA: hypothetical protein VJ850_04070 [Candidatus Limnocylindrales bacterium]|nr:hypothetical protein [Candidatus Limnocylindrales bacterium]